MNSSSRRDFLAKGASAIGGAALGTALSSTSAEAATIPISTIISARDFGAKGNGKTDDTAALRKAFKQSPAGTAVFFPRGQYVISGMIELQTKQSMIGEPFGAEIMVKHYDAPAVKVPGESRVSDFSFVYDNTDLINPKPSPETISLVGNGAGYIDNITFSHAFIGVGTPTEGANCGQSVIRKLNGFVHDTMVRIDGSLDIVRIENVHCFVECGPKDTDRSYYRTNRKCFHIKRSDGTLISKSFMIIGRIFVLKEAGATGSGLSTHMSECWCEAMSQYGIQVNDGSRLTVSQMEITSANAKALIELNNNSFAMLNGCYLRDSLNSRGIVTNSGGAFLLSNSEISGTPGFTGIEINSEGRTAISGNYIHHCEVGIRATAAADNYIITGNQSSLNNVPMDLVGGKNKSVSGNL